MRFIAHKLKYEFQYVENEVFYYGDQGEEFYIILEGEVSVLIPNPNRSSPAKIKPIKSDNLQV